MVVDNADVVFNCELAKMYAVILCDSEVILSLSLRQYVVKHSHGQIAFGFSGCADGSLALQFFLQAPGLLRYLQNIDGSNTNEEE